MQIRTPLLIVSAMALTSIASPATAQSRDDHDVLCNPASHEMDAVAAAPASHRVVFEDDHVRVLDIILPPLAIEPVHIHALPSVITGDTGGAEGARFLYATYELDGDKWVVLERNEIEPTPGRRTVWAEPEGPHSIANIGSVPVRFSRIEIKPESCAKAR